MNQLADSAQVPGLCERAQAALRVGDVASALTTLGRIVALDPNQAWAYLNLSVCLQRVGRTHEAVACLVRALELQPDQASEELFEAALEGCLASGLFTEGLHCAALGRERFPGSAALATKAAKIHFTQGEIDRGIRILEQAIAQNPALFESSIEQHVNLNFGSLLVSAKDCIVSLRYDLKRFLGEVAQLAPGLSRESHEEMRAGDELVVQGDFAGAVRWYQRLLATDTCPEHTHPRLGLVLAAWSSFDTRADRLVEALRHFNCTAELLPNSAWAAFCCVRAAAQIARRSGHYERDQAQFIAAYTALVARFPDFAPTYRELAEAHWDRAEILPALRYFKEFVRLRNSEMEKHPLGKTGVRFMSPFYYAMGHLALTAEVTVCLEKLGWVPRYKKIVLAPIPRIGNRALLDYWREHFQVITDQRTIDDLSLLGKELEYEMSFPLIRRAPSAEPEMVSEQFARSLAMEEWYRQGRGPLLCLKEEHRRDGWAQLEQVGIPRGSWFVALHVREAGFKQQQHCPFNAHRNADIADFEQAIRRITGRGGWVIRMGERSMKPLPKMPNVFDYAHSSIKCDWMEVFLCAETTFFLTTSAGVAQVAQLFKPIAGTNWPLTPPQHSSRDVYLTKLLYHEGERRLLSFREMLSEPLLHQQSGVVARNQGLRFVDNSPEEIAELVDEVISRIDGSVVYTAEDEELQARYRALYPQGMGQISCRIGRGFLRKYACLL